MSNKAISVIFAEIEHAIYAERICQLIYESALQRGTGIAKRSPEYIAAKIKGKNEFCIKHNLRLIRIPYWKNTITEQDIFGDKYLVKEAMNCGNY